MADLPPIGSPGSFFIFDLHCWIHVFFHVSGDRAARVFADRVKSVLRREPEYVAVASDCRGLTIRDEIFPDYKKTRRAKRALEPDKYEAIQKQVELAKALCADVGVKVIEVPRYEADDVVGSLLCLGGWSSAVMVASDKDLKKFVCKNVSLWNFKEVKGPVEVFADHAVWPEQMWDYLTIVGDRGDDVPGIKGLGKEYAVKILADYGTLANAMAHAHASPSTFFGTRHAKLMRDGVDAARLSAKLIRLRTDVDMGIKSVEELRVA
jgi:DNA polymerase-1